MLREQVADGKRRVELSRTAEPVVVRVLRFGLYEVGRRESDTGARLSLRRLDYAHDQRLHAVGRAGRPGKGVDGRATKERRLVEGTLALCNA